MAAPMIIFDLCPVVNPSFETGAVSTFPAGWTDNADPADTREIGNFLAHDRGSSGGTQSLNLNVTGAAGNVYQDIPWLPPVGTRIALAGMVGGTAGDNCRVRLVERDASSSYATANLDITIDATNVMQPFTKEHTIASSSADRIRILFGEFATHYTAGADFWLDYLHLGRLVDFPRGFQAISVEDEDRRALNLGGGTYETVSLGEPFATVRYDYGPVTIGSTLEAQLMAFRRAARSINRFAFWEDRDLYFNTDRHFSTCIADSGFPILRRLRFGPNRWHHSLGFTAPKESAVG